MCTLRGPFLLAVAGASTDARFEFGRIHSQQVDHGQLETSAGQLIRKSIQMRAI